MGVMRMMGVGMLILPVIIFIEDMAVVILDRKQDEEQSASVVLRRVCGLVLVDLI